MIKTKKGLDLPISGSPSTEIDSSTAINSIAVLGADYVGLKPTMMVDEGDQVQLGQKLFENKNLFLDLENWSKWSKCPKAMKWPLN